MNTRQKKKYIRRCISKKLIPNLRISNTICLHHGYGMYGTTTFETKTPIKYWYKHYTDLKRNAKDIKTIIGDDGYSKLMATHLIFDTTPSPVYAVEQCKKMLKKCYINRKKRKNMLLKGAIIDEYPTEKEIRS